MGQYYAYYVVENWPAERFNSPGLRPNGVSDPELTCCYGFSLILPVPRDYVVSKTGYPEPLAKRALASKRDLGSH